jgi:manganese transport protein
MTEANYLRELAGKPLVERLRGYAKLSGPGYMQSAMTLGGGTVASCVLMGSLLGYELLWVQPLAIFLGAMVLAAIAKQTCHTQAKPYGVFQRLLHPALALLWGISALVATIIWHFPQYSLSANGVTALLSGVGLDLAALDAGPRFAAQMFIGLAILALSAWVVSLYESGTTGLKVYEIAIKYLVWAIVIAFAVVAFASGIDFGRFARGITGISFLQRVLAEGLPASTIRPVVGGLAAAVGINMVFLYPYSLLRKKWGPAHKEVAYFDLATGMVLPFLIATTFIIVATANTIGPAEGQTGGEVRNILELVPVLSSTFGSGLSLVLIGFGMLAVGVSTIITHMLASGFIGCEIFGQSDNARARRWFSFLPAVGIFGVAYPFPWALSVTASTLAYPLMPIAVICFIVLLNRSDYMGSERPRGLNRLGWNTVLWFAVIFMIGAAWLAVAQNWADLQGYLAS